VPTNHIAATPVGYTTLNLCFITHRHLRHRHAPICHLPDSLSRHYLQHQRPGTSLNLSPILWSSFRGGGKGHHASAPLLTRTTKTPRLLPCFNHLPTSPTADYINYTKIAFTPRLPLHQDCLYTKTASTPRLPLCLSATQDHPSPLTPSPLHQHHHQFIFFSITLPLPLRPIPHIQSTIPISSLSYSPPPVITSQSPPQPSSPLSYFSHPRNCQSYNHRPSGLCRPCS
jgi:hypothetical protein